MPLDQFALGRERLCVPGGQPEPVVSPELILAAIGGAAEPYRALLPVGYDAGVDAYRQAMAGLTTDDLTHHYTDGLRYFHQQFAPYLKDVLSELTGGAWDLRDYCAYAAGSDVDFMTHLVSAAAAGGQVTLYPGDWHGFRVGVADARNISWSAGGGGALACLCVPSVRNGHVTPEMLGFLGRADACLLNINLFPTLSPADRQQTARDLLPVLEKSVLSVSFSRGFGLTGSQLGVALVHRDHPLRHAYETQWNWLTYFYNGVAARAFMALDIKALSQVDEARRDWVADWLKQNGLPVVRTGSYYVKSFRLSEPAPEAVRPLCRDGVLRLCLKPPISG
jgi:hypothetical protein